MRDRGPRPPDDPEPSRRAHVIGMILCCIPMVVVAVVLLISNR